MKPLETVEAFEALRSEPLAIVFKHSTVCSMSARARREVQQFQENRPEPEVHEVRVLESRELSDYIEKTTGVVHESPQLLVLRRGEVLWHGSHSRVTFKAMVAALS